MKRSPIYDRASLRIIQSISPCLLFSIISCSTWYNPLPPTRAELARQREISNPATDVIVEPFSSSMEASLSQSKQHAPEFGVELTWDIPTEPVETFVLYTGSNPENLNTEIHLSVSDLSLVESTKYRYVIKPVAGGAPFYVSLAAKYNGELSPRSPVQRINPEALGVP